MVQDIGTTLAVIKYVMALKLTFTQMDKRELKENSEWGNQFISLSTDKMELKRLNSGTLSRHRFTHELTIMMSQDSWTNMNCIKGNLNTKR